MKYIAIAINGNYWIKLSKPCSKEQAEVFSNSICFGEKFAVKTEREVINHKNKI